MLVIDRCRVIGGEVEVERRVVVEILIAAPFLPLNSIDRLRSTIDIPVGVLRRLVEGERRRVLDRQRRG